MHIIIVLIPLIYLIDYSYLLNSFLLCPDLMFWVCRAGNVTGVGQKELVSYLVAPVCHHNVSNPHPLKYLFCLLFPQFGCLTFIEFDTRRHKKSVLNLSLRYAPTSMICDIATTFEANYGPVCNSHTNMLWKLEAFIAQTLRMDF